MSKKSKLLDRHSEILKIAQDENHPGLQEAAGKLYDEIAAMGEEDDGDTGGNHPNEPPKKP